MTISYTLQPIFEWYLPDLLGKPLSGGKMYSYSSLNPNEFKPIFQDPAGTNQWPNPVVFSENGTAGPFYWELDTDNPDDLYFLQIFDSNNNLIYSINQYPISGGGGGGSISTVQNIENIIINSSFINNVATTAQPIADSTIVAPGAHSYLFYPDITFIQSGTSNAQDTVSFSKFTTGTNPLSPDFSTPYYLNYTCLNGPTGEIYKGIRIPISQNVNSVANQIFTFVFYARSNSGANTLNVQIRQYFGTGGSPSSPVVTNLTPSSITLTSSFAIYSINFSVPSVATKNLGDSNDDGTYLEILFPIGSACNIDIAKPNLYIGSSFPNISYESTDEITYKLEYPRTGDIKSSMNPFSNSPVQNGWIPLNDGTIGNISSNATTRAKPDSWLLFKLIWDNTTASDCPIYDTSGTAVSKGGTALSDWNANRSIQLPLTVGKVIADRGATGYSPTSLAYTSSVSTNLYTVSSTAGFKTGKPVILSGGTPSSFTFNGLVYFAIVVSSTTLRLATSSNNAIAGVPLVIGSNGSGTITTPPTYALGHAEGENVHKPTIAEMVNHNHTPGVRIRATGGSSGSGRSFFSPDTGPFNSVAVTDQGGSNPFSIFQPTVFYNMIIKL